MFWNELFFEIDFGSMPKPSKKMMSGRAAVLCAVSLEGLIEEIESTMRCIAEVMKFTKTIP